MNTRQADANKSKERMVRLGGKRAAAPSGPAHHPALCPQVARGRDKAQGGGEPRGERQA